MTVALLVGLLLSVAGCSKEEKKPKEPDRLPDVSLSSLNMDESLDLASMRGPMVVNLWASWCTPCRRELPLYQAYAEKYAGKVDVVGIDFQETRPGAALKLAADSGVRYPLYADPDGELRAETGERPAEVPLDVVVERLERRDVEEPQPLAGRLVEAVDPLQEGRERLARAGRRLDEDVRPGGDRGPPEHLRRRGAGERALEPGSRLRRQRGECVHLPSVSPGRWAGQYGRPYADAPHAR